MELIETTTKRIRSVLNLIENLQDSDFPYEHSEHVLEFIKSALELRIDNLNKLSPAAHPPIIKTQCKESLGYIHSIFRLIGFAVRSTDIRNSFELHGPFLRLLNKALGPNSKLVISSEWDYSPFTYNSAYFPGMEDFVFIGMPASESQTELTIPLSGHELGHNVWRKHDLDNEFGIRVSYEIVEHIENDIFDDYKNIFTHIIEKKHIQDIIGQKTWTLAYDWCLKQCQEVFCDCIGLLIFKESFLHSFAYLLAPGFPGMRPSTYLNVQDRVKCLINISNLYGINPIVNYIDNFEDSDEPTIPTHKMLLKISDHVTKLLVNELANKAKELFDDYHMEGYSLDEVVRIKKRFSVGVPVDKEHTLTNILNAAWSFYLEKFPGWSDKYPSIISNNDRCENMLTELVFKSIEVSEVMFLTNK